MHTQESLTSEIIALIERRTGLLLRDSHRTTDAKRAIIATIAELLLRDDHALYAQLNHHESHHPVWQKLLQLLTIGETYFFRNQAHFNTLRHQILPQMIERKRQLGQRWLRIWSAGCSTGEEIYSIAILIRELLPDYKDWSIYLIGTDINEAYLDHARQGFYRINSFRSETPESLHKDWFTKEGNISRLDAGIRRMVTFKNLNLVTDLYPTPDTTLKAMDIILCQNVTIYFDRPVTESIQEHLIQTLADDGWLILGHSEPLFVKTPYLAVRNFTNAVVFQRQAAPTPDIHTPSPELKLFPKPQPQSSAPTKIKRTTSPLSPVQEARDSANEMCHQAHRAADAQAWDEALALLDKVLQLHPLYEYAHYLRGLIYMEKSEFSQAMGALRQALYCNSNCILAHYTLGELYNLMGHIGHARHEWQLTQNLLGSLAPESLVPYSHDLISVEMLSGLLATQLSSGGLKS